jgi:phospholipase C
MGGRVGRRAVTLRRDNETGSKARRARSGLVAGDPIQHVVVLMLENRAFDQSLGGMQAELAIKGLRLDGVDPKAKPRENFAQSGPAVEQLPMDEDDLRAALTMPGPKHELTNVQLQLGNDNDYFVLDYVISHKTLFPAERELIMRYFPPGWLPATHELARHFTVCDRWFSSVPGPTWPNRFFVHSGTSMGRVLMPQGIFEPNLHLYHQDTIYDRLNERGISWRIYYGDIPHSLLLTHQWVPTNAARYRGFDHFAKDARGAAEEFPAYVFIEPKYMGDDANDDHPPHDVARGQRLIADVYNALRANRDLFNSTLLVLLYDEHGGFYDHVPPPPTVPPDEYDYEYDFKRLGVRVPALLVSPWVDNAVSSTTFDHTSLLKYLVDKWNLRPLGDRTAGANSFAAAIRSGGEPRADVPERLSGEPPDAVRAATRAVVTGRTAPLRTEPERWNEHQHAMLLFSKYLDTAPARPAQPTRQIRQLRSAVRAPAARGRELPGGEGRSAKRSVERFLRSR